MKKLYFAYGSNLSASDWRRYCARIEASPEGLRFLRAAWLPDWETSFHYRSETRQGGALTIHRRPGTAVPGALFEADAETWALLDRKEGVATGCYARVDVIALDEDGQEWPCTTYEVTEASRTEAPVPPADGYHEIVVAALTELGLPTQQLDAAAQGHTPDLLPGYLFTYGTLRRGESRWVAASEIACGDVTETRCPGILLDLSDYPGLINGSEDEQVMGEIVPLAAGPPWNESIDAIEDFLGYGHPDSLYRRIIRRLEGTDPASHAWTYLYIGPTQGLGRVRDNDWKKSRP